VQPPRAQVWPSIAIHHSYVGCNVVGSLFAIDLGASQVTVAGSQKRHL
jgi:hypothetical protein